MKSVLAVVSLALVALVLDDKARQVAGDAREAYGEVVDQAARSRDLVSLKVGTHPIFALLAAGGVGCALALLLPRRA